MTKEQILKLIEDKLVRKNSGSSLTNDLAEVAKCIVDETISSTYDFIPRILYVNRDGEKVMTHEISPEMTPIAIEVVPGSHMEDGKSRWMSLKNMSLADPENGTTATGNDESNPGAGIMWGNGESLIGDTEWNQVPIITDGDGYEDAVLIDLNMYEEPQSTYDYGYLPFASSNNGIEYKFSPNYKYIQSTNIYVAPPFNADGTANPAYRTTEVDGESINNPLSRFDGKEMTDLIIEAATDTETEGAITNSSEVGHYPAAMCCHRYVTEGTTAGDWYLPSAGELGYAVVNTVIINDIINELSDVGHDVVRIPELSISTYDEGLGDDLWSSTEYSAGNAIDFDYYGNVYHYYKSNDNSNLRVRAFLAL